MNKKAVDTLVSNPKPPQTISTRLSASVLQTQTPQEPEISDKLKQLESVIERVGNTFEDLEQKISPVLGPVPEMRRGHGKMTEPLSPLGKRLETSIDSLLTLEEKISEVLGRVQL